MQHASLYKVEITPNWFRNNIKTYEHKTVDVKDLQV